MNSKSTVSPTTRSVVARGRRSAPSSRLRPSRLTPLFAALLGVWSNQAYSLPTGAQPVAGSVTVTTPNAQTVNVKQATDKAIVNWSTFNVGKSELVNFAQPAASSMILNRVVGGSYSEILGRITANGQVFLVNPMGITLGTGAHVDAAGFLASTLSITNEDFLSGRYVFSNSGGAGKVVNQGVINTGSLAALLGPQVRNEGVISARVGTVGLAAGDRVSLDFRGDGLVKFSVDAAALNASVANQGVIIAEGGNIVMTAQSANALLDTVINMNGVARATALVERNGTIVLDGGEKGIVAVTGTLDASGLAPGASGGTVKVLGEKVGLFESARLDASGDRGGGTVLVGGNWQGKGPERNASMTIVGPDTTIAADALSAGDGGKVVVWADGITRYYGSIQARGGSASGNGGNIEVSGKSSLVYAGTVDARAPNGKTGNLLLDPTNVEVVAAGGNAVGGNAAARLATVDNFADADAGTVTNPTPPPATVAGTSIDVADINGAGANVTLQADVDVIFSTDVTITANGVGLTAQAGRHVILNGGGVARRIETDGGNITLQANDPGGSGSNAVTGVGSITGVGALSSVPAAGNNAGGNITLIVCGATCATAGGTGSISVGDIASSGRGSGQAGDVSLKVNSGDITTGLILALGGASGGNGGNVALSVASGTGNVNVNSIDTRKDNGGGGAGTPGNISVTSTGTTSQIAGVIQGGTFTKDGVGTLTLSGNNTYTGATTINNGNLVIRHANALGAAAAGTTVVGGALILDNNVVNVGEPITINGTGGGAGALQAAAGSTSSLTGTGTVTLGSNSTVGAGAAGSLTLGAAVTSTGAETLDKAGTGTLILSADNAATLAGPITISAGTLRADHANALGAVGAGTTVASGGALQVNNVALAAEPITINGTGPGNAGALQGTGAASVAGVVTLGSDSSIGVSSPLTLGQPISGGAFALTKVGTGTLVLANGANTFGALNVSAGTLNSGGADTLPNGSNVTVASGATLQIGATETIASLTNNGVLALGSDTVLTANGGIAFNTGSSVQGGGSSLTLTSSGNKTLNGTTLTNVNNLTADGGGTVSLGGTITTGGSQAYSDPITLLAHTTLAGTNGSFAGIAGGGFDLTLNFSLATTITGTTFANVNNFASGGGGTTDLSGTITTAGTQTYTDAVTLSGPTVLVSTGNQAIALNSTVNGAASLAVNTTGTTTFGNAVGGTTPLTSLATNAGGTTNVAGNVSTTNGPVNFGDNVVLTTGPVIVSAGNGAVTFGGTVNGGQTLTINSTGATTFNGAVGGGTPLASLSTDPGGANTVINGGVVTTTGAQSYGDGVTLGANTTLAGTTGSFTSINGGGFDLTLNFSGLTSINAASFANVNNFASGGGGTTSLNGVLITAGSQTYDDAVTLSGPTVLTSTGNQAIALNSTVNGAQALTVNTTGTTTFGAAVGGTTPLTQLITNAGGTTNVAGNVSTTGLVSFDDNVVLTTGAVQVSAANAVFGGTVNGAQALTVNSAGATTFGGIVGGTTPLASLTTNGGGTTAINTTAITTSGLQSYGDAVTLGAGPVVLTSNAAGNITFASTLDGAQALTINTGGTTGFNGQVGAMTPLASITTDAGGTTVPNIAGAPGLVSISTTGNQTYNDQLSLGNHTKLAAPMGVIALNGGFAANGFSLTGTDSTGCDLTAGNLSGGQTFNNCLNLIGAFSIDALSMGVNQSVTFNQAVNGGNALTITNVLTATFNAAVGNLVPLASVSISGTNTLLQASGGSVTTTGAQTYNTLLALAVPTVLTSTGGGNIAVNGVVIANPVAFTVNTSGTTTFGGIVGGSGLPPSSLTTDAPGTTALNAGTVITTGAQTYGDAVTLGAVTTLNAGTDITFGNTLNGGQTLVLNAPGTIAFAGIVGGGAPLASITANGGTTAISTTAITTSGAQTYSGAVTLGAAATLASTGAGGIAFNGPVDGAQMLAVNTAGTTTFGGAVGGTIPLGALTTDAGGSTAIGGGAVTTTGNQAYNDAVTLGADAILSSGAGSITFASTVQSPGAARALTLSSAGATTFGGVVGGGGNPLASLTTDAAGTTAINTTAITTTGAQTYADPVTLGANVVLASSGGGAIAFGSTVNGAQTLAVNTTGATTFGGTVGGTTALTSLTTDAGGTTAINGGSVTTTGTQAYNDAVTLGAGTTLTSTGNAIAFNSTLDGAQTLNVNAPFPVTFGGAVGGTTPLISITTDVGPGTVFFNGGSVTTTGNQTYNDPVSLGADTVLTAGAGNITFGSSVNSPGTPRSLTLNSSGLTVFGDVVGPGSPMGANPLLAVTTDAGGTTVINTTTINTAAGQTYNDAVSLGANVVLTSTGAGNIALNGTVNGARSLTVNTTGTTTFGGLVGGATPLTTLTTDAGGSTAINGGGVTTSGAQSYNDAVSLGANTTLTGTAGTFAAGINGGGFDLTLIFSSPTAVSGAAIGNVANFASGGGGATTLSGALTTTGSQTFNTPVTLGGATTLTSTGAGNITFASTVNGAQPLTVNTGGTTTFGGAVGSTTAPTSLTTDAGGTTAINGGSITTATTQTYGDQITLGANTVLTGTTGTFGSGINANGFNLTLNFSGASTINGNTFVGIGNLTTGSGGTTNLIGSLTTAGAQTYGDPVNLIGATALASTAGGAISFAGTVNGAQPLTVNTSGATTFTGLIGGTTPLASLTTNAGGTTTISGSATSTTGAQTYNDTVSLPGAATFTASGPIAFNGSLSAPGQLTVINASSITVAQAVGNLSVSLPTPTTASLNATGNLLVNAGTNVPIALGNSSAGGTLNVNATGTGTITQLTGSTVQSGGDLRLRAPNGDITVGNVISATEIEINNTVPPPSPLTGEGRVLSQLAGTQLSAPFVRMIAGFNGLGPNNIAMGTREAPVRFANTVQQVDYAAPEGSLIFFAGPLRLQDDKKIILIQPPGGAATFDFNGSSARASQAATVAAEVVGGITQQVTEEIEAGFRPGRIDQVILFGFQGDLSVATPPVLGAIRGILLPEPEASDLDPKRRKK